jgi:hypothetical protein
MPGLVPVDHDPFAATLTPVDHDPFADLQSYASQLAPDPNAGMSHYVGQSGAAYPLSAMVQDKSVPMPIRIGAALPVELGHIGQGLLSAVTLPGDVYAGRTDPMSPEGFARTQGLATLVSGGRLATSREGLGMGWSSTPYMDAQAESIARAMAEDPDYTYGLRTTEEPLKVGERPPRSRVWDNGDPTDEDLPGTSAVRIREATPEAVKKAFRYAGIGGDGPNGTYFGKHVSLLKGYDTGVPGVDYEEIVMDEPVVHSTFEKAHEGSGSLVDPGQQTFKLTPVDHDPFQ